MSGVTVINYLLSHHAPLLAQVPAARIISGVVEVGTALPAISVLQISGQQRNPVAMNAAAYLVTERVQVTVMAASYAKQKELLALVRAACPVSRGSVNNVAVEAVLPDTEGPDMYLSEGRVCMQSLDFIVRFNR